jgi:ribosome-associated translation inhibitor RaiA
MNSPVRIITTPSTEASMQVPLDITAQNLDLPYSAEALIRRSASKLDKLHDGLVACRVVVEGPGNRHRSGGPYRVRVHLTVPGKELAVDRKEEQDLTAAIRAAFEAARRQIVDHARVLKGDVKRRAGEPAIAVG